MVLDSFFKKFQDNLYNYLYERDIQSDLLCHLRKELSDYDRKFEFKYQNDDVYKSQNCNFSLIRSEYHVDNKILDIAILDEDHFISNDFQINGNPLYCQKIDVGIEIKFNAFNSDYSFINDINSLTSLIANNKIKTGISLLFSHKEVKFEDYPRINVLDSYRSVNETAYILSIKEDKVNSFIISSKEVMHRVLSKWKNTTTKDSSVPPRGTLLFHFQLCNNFDLISSLIRKRIFYA